MINHNLTGDLEWVNGRPLYVSMSGGKDSTALALHLRRLGVKFTPVFLDTGWEHEATYDYIQDVLTPAFGEFIKLRNESLFDENNKDWAGGMEQLIQKNKMFASGVVKFCTRQLKVIPVQNFFAEQRVLQKVKPINAIGIRAEESASRANLAEIEEQDEATVWRPLIAWREQQVIDIHTEERMPPNPLYIKGAARVGCYPCIFARKHQIRHMSYTDPARVDHIADLERRVNELRQEQGKEPNATFFKSRRADKEPMNIYEIVEWSRTDNKHGYLDDVEDIEEEGCMRWGLCERPAPAQMSLFDEE